MLDGAIGANEKIQNIQSENAQKSSEQAQQSSELANLDFLELGKKFREAINQAEKDAAKVRTDKKEKYPPDGQLPGSPEKTKLAEGNLDSQLTYA